MLTTRTMLEAISQTYSSCIAEPCLSMSPHMARLLKIIWLQMPLLFLKNCFSYSKSSVVPYEFGVCFFFSISAGNAIEILRGIVQTLHIALNIRSYNQWTWDVFPFLCVVFIFFQQCFIVFSVQIFHFVG